VDRVEITEGNASENGHTMPPIHPIKQNTGQSQLLELSQAATNDDLRSDNQQGSASCRWFRNKGQKW